MFSFQEKPYYDQKGNILSQIKFVIVDGFEIGNYELFLVGVTEETVLYLSRENVPERIWWFNKHIGQTEIKWY